VSNKINIGLFGLGTVGLGFNKLLCENKNSEFVISKICVRQKNENRDVAANLITYNKNDILYDDTIDIVVELIDDSEKAYEIVKVAIENGKHVITANKKMIAEHYLEIHDLAEKYNVQLLFEASTCASIPILHLLDSYYTVGNLNSLTGILNGSSNFVLTKMSDAKMSYESALLLAQEKGFAESDSSLDMDGSDCKYKLSILIAKTYGVWVNPDIIPCFGIEGITNDDIILAKQENKVIKLIGHVQLENDQLMYWVAPTLVGINDALSGVKNENNAVVVSSQDVFGDQLLQGKGAGAYPTAYAVMADLYLLKAQPLSKRRRVYEQDSASIDKHRKEEILLRFNSEFFNNDNNFNSILFYKKTDESWYYRVRVSFRELYEIFLLESYKFTVVGVYKDELKRAGDTKYVSVH
jgi:homoserine dehydrogenase